MIDNHLSMIDQLHEFATQTEADAAFPRSLDDDGNPIQAPCWTDGTATIMPLTVFVLDGETVRPSASVWLGLSCREEHADDWWSKPSARVELSRPEDKPEFWLTRVTRSQLPAEAAVTVMGASPQFGPGYSFPEWP